MRKLETEVLVIGGGATGAGVVRDAAMRGFKTAIVERSDWTTGTTGRYHGLLHSGGRYAVKDPEAAIECIEENKILRHIMPHCLEDTGGFFVVTPWDEPAFSERVACRVHCMRVNLRTVVPEDMDFLFQVYASVREEELARVDWNEAQKHAFLQIQFAAQHTTYTENYAGAEFQIVEVDNQAAGRLYVHRRPDEIRIMDIALLPAYRNQGIGSRLLAGLLDEGQAEGKSVTIHVESFNRAQRLYERLGFRQIAEHGVYLLMEWKPAHRSSDG